MDTPFIAAASYASALAAKVVPPNRSRTAFMTLLPHLLFRRDTSCAESCRNASPSSGSLRTPKSLADGFHDAPAAPALPEGHLLRRELPERLAEQRLAEDLQERQYGDVPAPRVRHVRDGALVRQDGPGEILAAAVVSIRERRVEHHACVVVADHRHRAGSEMLDDAALLLLGPVLEDVLHDECAVPVHGQGHPICDEAVDDGGHLARLQVLQHSLQHSIGIPVARKPARGLGATLQNIVDDELTLARPHGDHELLQDMVRVRTPHHVPSV
eukprot:CAMPEP_0198612360 /NCGR_PEP_ID=MMETSP1462-20131121/157855_1 /TAXON_ID=1333877 /ORGANISM="Brandtodinium nutriculum, Strain RCC3387" /LENGTH=270 /DNA_ID=CAMNT_0044344161 /DNA_START=231 /DNA_END=1039 /DNA_ORIENTATION=+